MWAKVGVAGRCWGCGGLGHRFSACSGRTLPVTDANGVFPPGMNVGGGKRTGGPCIGTPIGRGGMLRSGSILGYESRSRALAGGALLGAR